MSESRQMTDHRCGRLGDARVERRRAGRPVANQCETYLDAAETRRAGRVLGRRARVHRGFEFGLEPRQRALDPRIEDPRPSTRSDGIEFTDVPPPMTPILKVVFGESGTVTRENTAAACPSAKAGLTRPNAP